MRAEQGMLVMATAGLALVVMSFIPVGAQEAGAGAVDRQSQCQSQSQRQCEATATAAERECIGQCTVATGCTVSVAECTADPETTQTTRKADDLQVAHDELRRRLADLQIQLAALQGLISVEIEEQASALVPIENLNAATPGVVPSMVVLGAGTATDARPAGEGGCQFQGGWFEYEVPGNDGQACVRIGGDSDAAFSLRARVHEILCENMTSDQLRQALASTVAGIDNEPQTCREAIALGTAVIVTDDGRLRIALRAQSDGPAAWRQASRLSMGSRRGPAGMRALGPDRAIAPQPQPRRAVQAWQKQGCCCCCCGSPRSGRGGAGGAVTGIPGMPRRAAILWPQPPPPSGNLLEPGKVQIQIRIVDCQGNVIEERVIEHTVEETPAVFDDPTN